MLGQEVTRLAPRWANVVPLTRADADLTRADEVRACLTEVGPDVVVHCAAWTDVDGASREPAAAWEANAEATGHVANVCSDIGARLLYVSTDYVFDGEDGPYVESDRPSPINAYGKSKLGGEEAARRCEDHLIVRTQWLYGPGGRNFVAAILDAARSGRSLRVVKNEYGRPTYTPDLARGIWRVLQVRARGVLHLTNSRSCSRLRFAQVALKMAGLENVQIRGIPSEQWDSPTRRPLNAILRSERMEELGIEPLRPWREALREYVNILTTRWAHA